MPFGLKPEIIEQIQKVLSLFPCIKETVIYGSRAKGNFKIGSDIDLCLKGEGIDLALLARIDEKLDDLFLPYTFDISIYDDISNPEFLDHIERVGISFYQRSA